MWCSFEGPPRIVRIHARGKVVSTEDSEFQGVFDEIPGARSIIVATAERISDSCGYSVPVMKYEEERSRLREWAENKTDQELSEYRLQKNSASIDGLPALNQ